VSFLAILKNFKANLTPSDHKPTTDVLNTHAGVIASQYKTGSDRFYALFSEFVNLFEDTGEGYEEGYLDENVTNNVAQAYWAFVSCMKTEVARAEAAEANEWCFLWRFCSIVYYYLGTHATEMRFSKKSNELHMMRKATKYAERNEKAE
jgi:hypothetical protein